jgi:hypothetical protein
MTSAIAAALEKLDKAIPAAHYRQDVSDPQLTICEPTLVIVDSPKPAVTAALTELFNALVAARSVEVGEAGR